MDSGNDAAEKLGILIEDGSWFVIKRNLRRAESKEEWLAKVKECCKDIRHPRDGKEVYVGSSWKDVSYITESGEEKSVCMRIVYEVIERTIDKHGQFLLIPDIEVNTFWTNLGDSDDDIIDLYHAMVKWSSIIARSRPTWMLSGFLPVNSTPMNWCWNLHFWLTTS